MTLAAICDEKLAQLETILNDKERKPYHAQAMSLQWEFRMLKIDNDTSPEGAANLLDSLHQLQRLNFACHADLKGDAADEYHEVVKGQPHWIDLPSLPVAPELREKLAGQMIASNLQHIEGGSFDPFDPNLPPRRKDKMMLRLSVPSRGIAEHVVSYLLRHDASFEVDFNDELCKKTLYERCDEEQMKRVVAYNATRYDGVNNRLSLYANPPAAVAKETGLDPDKKKRDAFAVPIQALQDRIQAGDAFHSVTYLPTQSDAELDGMDYQSYLKLYFESCDQPWGAIQQAQAHLIEKLNNAHRVHIVDKDTGTDLSMRIDGKQWINSLALKNIPGSEVFASATRESVNGTLVSKGSFYPRPGALVKDITLVFKNGRVESFDAAEGKEHLERFLHMDDGKGEGTRYTGELAFGTNPWLQNHMVNGLLVEKISRSFHIALGGAYKYTSYDGLPALVDNGNRSASGMHWDVTTMMKGPKSRIVLDEGMPYAYVVMEGGRFTDPALNVFNEGWAALPQEQQPDYWQKRLQQPQASSKQRANA